MIKCQQCRDKDVDLLTWYERLRNWLFYKVNYVFFSDDLNDLTSQKYTQGFSDGITQGVEREKNSFERYKEMYMQEPVKPSEDEVDKAVSRLLSPVDWTKIVTLDKNKGLLFIGGERATPEQLSNLKSEADFLVESTLWSLLMETPKKLAQDTVFVHSEDIVDLQKGKSMLYYLSQQNNIVQLFKNYVATK